MRETNVELFKERKPGLEKTRGVKTDETEKRGPDKEGSPRKPGVGRVGGGK